MNAAAMGWKHNQEKTRHRGSPNQASKQGAKESDLPGAQRGSLPCASGSTGAILLRISEDVLKARQPEPDGARQRGRQMQYSEQASVSVTAASGKVSFT